MQCNMRFLVIAVACGSSAMMASSAWGAVIAPSSATASSSYFLRPTSGSINGSGLDGIGAVETQKHREVANGETWLTDGPGTDPLPVHIEFDFGIERTLDKFYVWNYAETNGGSTLAFLNRGAKDVQVFYGNAPNPGNSAGNFVFNIATGTANGSEADYTTSAQTLNFGSAITARYLRFDITTDHGGDGYVGLSEVRFNEQDLPQTFTSDYIRPAAAVASSEYAPNGSDQRTAVKTIDGSGLNAAGQHAASDVNAFWLTNNTSTGTITYDLGARTLLTGLRVWNYNEGYVGNPNNYAERSIKDVNISVSNDGINFSLPIAAQFNQATGTATYTGDTYSTPVPVLARYVRLDGTSTFGNTQGNFLGLSEVRFTTNSQITTATATASTEYTPDGRLAGRLLDNSGMTGALNERAGTAPGGNMWLSDGSSIAGQTVTFDLHAAYPLESTRIWNYNEVNFSGRGVQSLNIATSLDGVSFTDLGPFTLLQATGLNDYLGSNLINLGGGVARWVRFTVNSSYGQDQFVGLSEVRFYSAVPEPSTLALLGLGFAALVSVRRRMGK